MSDGKQNGDLDDALQNQELIGVDQVLGLINQTFPDERSGPTEVESLMRELSDAPETNPVELNRVTISDEAAFVEYLPEHRGLPEMHAKGQYYDLFCAENDGVWINTSESRIVTVRCGVALLVGAKVEVQIRQLPEMVSAGIMAIPDSYDDSHNGVELKVTLVNLSTTRKRIEWGQRIARLVFSRFTPVVLIPVTGMLVNR